MFGGGTLAVVTNAGRARRSRAEHRDAFLAAIGLVAPGNALVILEASQSGAKAPAQKRLADAIAAAGGTVREFRSPQGGCARRLDRGRGTRARPAARARAPPRPWPSASVASSRRATPNAATRPGSPRWSSTSSPSTGARRRLARRRPGPGRGGGAGLGLGLHRRRRRAARGARPRRAGPAARDHAGAGPAGRPPPARARADRDRRSPALRRAIARRRPRRWVSPASSDGRCAVRQSCGRPTS